MAATLLPREREDLAPDAVWMPDHLSLGDQRRLVGAWHEWRSGPAGARRLTMPNGATMSIDTVSLGWHWSPYRYSRTVDGITPVRELPRWLVCQARAALVAAWGEDAAADYRPDVALVNFYGPGSKLGLHRDADEGCDAPIVSFSVGDRGRFRFGNTETRGRPWRDVDLESGDVVVFGGASRYAYHGVTRIFPGTATAETGLGTGRLNITLRTTGR
ncbi:MAG: alpha-ketoglutarate-dependent dioxygenase AlkB [Microthrixaceae bacterium]